MNNQLPSFEVLLDVFRKTTELTRKSTTESLLKVENEIRDSLSTQSELDLELMLKIINKHLNR